MRTAIIADLHANLEATCAVFRAIDERAPDQTVCLGDLCGYNAEPNEVIDLVRERGIASTMGNHDAVACGLEAPWFFRAAAKKAIEWQLERITDVNKTWLSKTVDPLKMDPRCLCVHGSPGHRDDYIVDWLDAMRQVEILVKNGISICFFGHSHRTSLFSERGASQPVTPGSVHDLRRMDRYFINPGAVGQPRDGDPRAAFGLFDSDKMTFEFCRVEYDVEACARKVIAAGLPPELAKRLALGR